MRHGTIHAYFNLGCRCDECKRVSVLYRTDRAEYHRQKQMGRAPYGQGDGGYRRRQRIPRDHLQVTCWCEKAVVVVPDDDVLNLRTASCGLPDCTPELVSA